MQRLEVRGAVRTTIVVVRRQRVNNLSQSEKTDFDRTDTA